MALKNCPNGFLVSSSENDILNKKHSPDEHENDGNEKIEILPEDG